MKVVLSSSNKSVISCLNRPTSMRVFQFIIVSTVLFLAACQGELEYSLKGKFKNAEGKSLYIEKAGVQGFQTINTALPFKPLPHVVSHQIHVYCVRVFRFPAFTAFTRIVNAPHCSECFDFHPHNLTIKLVDIHTSAMRS